MAPSSAPAALDTPDAVSTDYGFLEAALRERDAAAFVHVGDRSDPDQRYLTRVSGAGRASSTSAFAFVYTDGEATLCSPDPDADSYFPGDVVSGPSAFDASAPGARAAEALTRRGVSGTVLVPQHIPHDAALYLERAGFELASTDAVAATRTTKSEAELACLRAVQTSACRAMARVETLLAESEANQEEGLTDRRLRREANAALALEGLEPAGNTSIVVGGDPSGPRLSETPVRPGETVVVSLSPRGPHGYHGALTRTFAVDAEGGWERRAHLAVQRALDAGREVLADGAGVSATDVHAEIAAEAVAFGFDAGPAEATGHGVGLSRREAPSLAGDAPLEAGTVLALEPGVADSAEGRVRVGDLFVVTERGVETLGDYPHSLVPQVRDVP